MPIGIPCHDRRLTSDGQSSMTDHRSVVKGPLAS
jgi:hypothetical protein